nr:NusG domain II-containing protein [uncultured Dorea sp.]
MLKKRKKDLIFIFSILIFAVFLLLIQRVYGNAQDEADLVKITVNQKLYGTYDLNKNQTITIQNDFGINTIQIQNKDVWMEEADCPDGYCKEQGHISKNKQTIVCLPHKLVVEISDDSEKSEPDSVDMIVN